MNATYIRTKRMAIGLSVVEFADYLDTTEGEVHKWESGNSTPTPAKFKLIEAMTECCPYGDAKIHHKFRFIDLFAGIGGMRLPFQELGGNCVFSSEWDKFSKRTYVNNFGDYPSGDITRIMTKTIPAHDLLITGFPCQSFSKAGHMKGFYDTRGTMFFEIQRVFGRTSTKSILARKCEAIERA